MWGTAGPRPVGSRPILLPDRRATPVAGRPRTPAVHRARTLRRAAPVLAVAVVAGCAGPSRDVASAPAPSTVPAAVAPAREDVVETRSYGEHPDTVFDVHRPEGAPSGLTVVLVHGGFWRDRYRRDLMDPLVPSLLDDGHLVVNLEYRRVGGDGGWPTTLTDVAAGLDAVAEVDGVDPQRVVVVGHSAGGHLATWLAARHRLPAGAPGASPRVRPCRVVAQAPVVVLGDAVDDDLGDGAVGALLGSDDPDRLRVADPSVWLPLGIPVTLVHAPADDLVPLRQSERWVELATAAGDEAELVTAEGDHFSVIDPAHELWEAALATVRDAC